jgi:hypothetical protein
MMMKHDYIPFQIQPVAGYTDLFSANDRLVQNNYDVCVCRTRSCLVEDDCLSESRRFDIGVAHLLSAVVA